VATSAGPAPRDRPARLKRLGGREIDTAGDGFFALLDQPARAIRCAAAIVHDVHQANPQAALATIELHAGAAPIGVAVGGGSVWVAESLKGKVARIDSVETANRAIGRSSERSPGP
jgi:hypothetical protein